MANVIIIGAGPAGLMAGITAARNNHKVTILDRANKAGKKLFATGNGKCNFTNLHIDETVFRSQNPEQAYLAYEKFNNDRLIEFFNQLGLLHRNNNGYIYPYSEQASSVVETLLNEANRLNINIIIDEQVNNFNKTSKGFIIKSSKNTYNCDKLIIAVGGLAQPKLGSDGSLYDAIKNAGHRFTKTSPALCSLMYKDKELFFLQGVRVKCKVSLNINDNKTYCDSGEIIFNKDNISGIPVMQLSRYAAYAWVNKENPTLSLDFYEQFTEKELVDLLMERLRGPYAGDKTVSQVLTGFMNNKLLSCLLKRAGVDDKTKAIKLNDAVIIKIANLMKAFEVMVIKTNTYENAQVMAGGVKLNEINDNFESNIVKDLYFAGEILDVDGKCGGYNLQWAFTSGYIAGQLK